MYGDLFSQKTITISGPSNVAPGSTQTYTASFNYFNSTITWTASGGTITSSNNTTCVVLWDNTSGSGSISARDAVNNVTRLKLVTRGSLQFCAVANAGNDVTICSGSSTTIGGSAIAGYTYSWSPTTGLNNPNVAQPIASPTSTTSYTLTVAHNLIQNGDFEQGNTLFSSDYLLHPNGLGGPGGTGRYAISSNPSLFGPGWCNIPDHTLSGTLMMVIDGTGGDVTKRVWYQQVTVTPNTSYNFSGFAYSLYAEVPQFCGPSCGQPIIEVKINGSIIYSSAMTYQGCSAGWTQFGNTWTSLSTDFTALIEIRTIAGKSNGNDFVIDDLTFKNNCPITTDNVTVFSGGGAPSISPAGPITYYNQYETPNQVVLTSTPAISYQWYKNNVVISGATNQTYLISMIGLGNSTDYYKVVTSCGTSNTVTFNYIGCDSPSDYPVSIPVSPCASTFPLTITQSNLGTGTTYSWWSGSPAAYTFSNFLNNTCRLNFSGCTSNCDNGIYTKAKKNGQEVYMYYIVVANPGCRPAKNINTYTPISKSKTTTNETKEIPSFSKARLIPNPANFQFTINAVYDIESIEIYNISGIMIKKINTKKSKSIVVKTHNLESGIYICKVGTLAGTEYVKLLIQR